MRNRSHILIIIVVLCLGVTNVWSQDNSPKPITKSGSAAFIFSMSGPGTFGLGGPGTSNWFGLSDNNPYEPAAPISMAHAGIRYFVDDNMAIRGLVSFEISNNGNSDAEETYNEVGIGVGVEYHMTPLYSTSPYIGGGIGYFMSSYSSPTPILEGVNNPSQQPQADKYEYKTSGLGVSVVAGFDWYLWKGIAIGAEYSLGYASGSTKLIDKDGTEHKGGSPSKIGISGGSNIHLVVYF